MQLMKQNGIQVNNNNNSAESRAQLSERLAALQLPSRAEAAAGEGCLSLVTHGAILALTLAMSQDDGCIIVITMTLTIASQAFWKQGPIKA